MMKKTIGIALAAILCIGGAFAVETRKPEITQIEERNSSGKEIIQQIRAEYNDGEYNELLRELDRAYEKAIDNEYILGLGKFRRGSPVDLQWLDAVKTIKKETNANLIQAVQSSDSDFASIVRNVATTDDLENLFLNFHQMQPGMGKNSDENALIDLDLEYEYKAIRVDRPGIETPNKKELHYALKMEQMDKILLVSQGFTDIALKNAIQQFAENIDARLARHADLIDLKSLAKGNTFADSKEEKVATILKEHQEKIQELTKKYVLEHTK